MGLDFDWGLAGLDNARFAALTSLLSLRNEGQLDPSAEILQTNQAISMADSTGTLKAQFLNRLAEVLSREKGPLFVACTAMREHGHAVDLWVSRNEGFGTEDMLFISNLESLLVRLHNHNALRQKSAFEDAKSELWELLLPFYSSRLKTHVALMRADFPAALMTDSPVVRSVKELLAVAPSDAGELVSRASKILEKWSNPKAFAHASPFFPPDAFKPFKVWRQIAFLARLKYAYRTFLQCAVTLQSFANIKIETIPKGNFVVERYFFPWTFWGTLNHLNVGVKDPAYRAMVANDTSLARTIAQFDCKQTPRRHVHAEVQAMFYLMKLGFDSNSIFPYLGCSKYACVLCQLLIKAMGYGNKGCHGKAYSLWTLPKVTGLSKDALDRLVAAIGSIEAIIIAELKKPPMSPVRLLAESTIGTPVSMSEVARTASVASDADIADEDFSETEELPSELDVQEILDEVPDAVFDPMAVPVNQGSDDDGEDNDDTPTPRHLSPALNATDADKAHQSDESNAVAATPVEIRSTIPSLPSIREETESEMGTDIISEAQESTSNTNTTVRAVVLQSEQRNLGQLHQQPAHRPAHRDELRTISSDILSPESRIANGNDGTVIAPLVDANSAGIRGYGVPGKAARQRYIRSDTEMSSSGSSYPISGSDRMRDIPFHDEELCDAYRALQRPEVVGAAKESLEKAARNRLSFLSARSGTQNGRRQRVCYDFGDSSWAKDLQIQMRKISQSLETLESTIQDFSG